MGLIRTFAREENYNKLTQNYVLMKKSLLTLITFVTALFTATAQTNLVENGDFETWTDEMPVNWKSTTTASSATLSKSEDAHNGAASVLVKGASSNKRISYKELTLKPGTYTMEFYAKAAVAGENASVRPGYAIVEDGKIINNGYMYGDYTNDIAAEWVKVSHQFTLEAVQTINILVMNPKKPGKDLLIDDFSFTTLDGGLSEVGPSPEPEPEPQPEPGKPAVFEETFADGQGQFTIEDKNLPEDLTFIWKHDTYNGKSYMKASAFANNTKYASESWLVSPVIDLTKTTAPELSFSNAANFFSEGFSCTVKVKEEGAADWTNLTLINPSEGMSWNFVDTSADMKAYKGKKVQLAFVYTSTATAAGTWEVKDVKIIDTVNTAIDNVTTDNAKKVIFDLSGRRVLKATKGLYIINGQKVYVK